jgi:diaminopimelate epimerase
VNMGQPEVLGELAIETIGARVVGTKVSMGNPHFVIFVENFPDGWQRQAALIAAQPQFPQGTNVEYVVVRTAVVRTKLVQTKLVQTKNARGPHEMEIRLFERGAGETQSSGTGSCAAAVAAIASGRVASPVTVIAPGGPQTVRWENQVYLRGPATLVCRGEFFV